MGHTPGDEIDPRKGENEYELLFINGKRLLENALTHDKNVDAMVAQMMQNAVTQQNIVFEVMADRMKKSNETSDLRAKRVEDAFDTREKERIEGQEVLKGGD